MKIAVLVSGGVDSSLALKLLKDQGHDLTAFYLKIWLEDELSSLTSCPWEEDLSYVSAICEKFKVPLKILNLQEEYHKKVVSYTIAEAKAGRTPNPDVLCNQHIKFGVFLDALSKEFDKVATGHYAQIENYSLKRAPDPVKDQTYFLCNLNKKQLSRIMFPIGHLNKTEVRRLANQFDLPNKDRKDSQGICFLGKFKFRDFLAQHLGTQSGPLLELETNKKLGEHNGHWFYTIGQRRDIRLSGGPWYIVKKDPEKNIVYVSNKYEEVEETRRQFFVTNLHWINQPPSQKNLLVKIRHKSTPQKCLLEISGNEARVTLEKKDQGIASGQFAVFYDKSLCLGSGIIN